jgi:hypothetical protein
MTIDWNAMRTFSSRHADIGPRTGPPLATLTPTPTPSGTPATATPTATATLPVPTFTVSTSASPAEAWPGATVSIGVTVSASGPGTALVDVEAYALNGTKMLQQVYDNQAFVAGQPVQYSLSWPVPSTAPAGQYILKVGVFKPGWGMLYTWEDDAADVTVAAKAPTTVPTATPTRGPPTATATPTPIVSCSPRPPVTVRVAPTGSGLLDVSVTVSGAGNVLRELRFGPAQNALLDLPDGRLGQTGGVSYQAPGGTVRATFRVRRSASGGTTVPFTVVDQCGGWQTFVGGGASLGF